MKRIFKILFALLLTFSLCYFVFIAALNSPNAYVYAADSEEEASEDEKKLSPESEEQIRLAKEATDAYCQEDKKVEGCLYDRESTLYTESNYSIKFCDTLTTKDGKSCYPYQAYNVPLRRGYQAFNGNGEAIFVGCYKTVYHYDEALIKECNKKGVTPCSRPFDDNTTLFIFKVIYPKKNSCSYATYIVPEKGAINYIKLSFSTNRDLYDGVTAVNSSGNPNHFATFQGWTATADAECPNIFGYTSNSNWATDKSNLYTFAASQLDYHQTGVISFLKDEEYKNRPGCTVEDVAGENRNQELLDEILDELDERKCPDKMEDMATFENDLTAWYDYIRSSDNNRYKELWSKGLDDRITGQDVKNQISDAFKSKVNICKYGICKLTQNEINAVEDSKGKDCKNGCTISRNNPQSDSTNARCYLCDNGINSERIYYWQENVSGFPNCEKVDRPKEQCFGSPKDQACISCYNRAFKSANLSDEKKECLLANELAAAVTIQSFDKKNEDAAKDAVAKDMQEAAELREELFNRESPLLEQIYLFINDEPMTCIDIVGPVLGQIIKGGITIVQIVAAIIALVKGMLILIPAVVAKDADALKKAGKTLVILGIILALVIIFRPLVRILGDLLEYDTTCIL